MEVKIPGVQLLRKRSDQGQPNIGKDRLQASDYYYHEQFMESLSSASNSKWDDDRAWSSQEWKTGSRDFRSDRGDLMKLLGERHKKFDLVSLMRNSSRRNRAIRYGIR